jgi:glycosyltransferase involved in cell wall biosynthesis
VSRRAVSNKPGIHTGPMRVLIVTNGWIYGGRDRVVKSLCEGFRESVGWDVTLVVARSRRAGGSALLERFPEPQGTPVLFVDTEQSRGIVLPLGRIVRKLNPDVVFWHADAGFFPYYWLACVLAGCAGRVVAVHHGILPTRGTSVRSRLAERVRGIVARRIAMNVAVSSGTASAVEERYRLKAGAVQVIRNAIDPLDIRTRASGDEPEELQGRHPVILVVARLSVEKNWETLIGAFGAVAGATRANLCIVGEGEERERILQLARDAGVADRVVLTGNQSNPYVYMSHADVFVLCSHHEGFGMVLLEAMACGVPVVATDCESGPREVITQGKNGLLVAPEDPTALAEGILAVLTDTELAQRLRAGGLERAGQMSLDSAVEVYHQMAERMCAWSQ